ncbi:hypothetical protein DB347_09970 [Opitutaceae bacterium EW11]|nr:hypothetical protein DB347_09970 [Opitutaceae bacterium EW11]
MGTSRAITVPAWRTPALALLVALGAFLLRLPGLQSRPFHTDEAVNAFILDEVFESGYHYRTHDHHGPTLYQIAAAVLGPLGIRHPAQMEPWMLRGFTAVFGALLAASVFWALLDAPLSARVAAAVALGIGAPFVYYSGIFIHELLLMLLLLLFFGSFLRLTKACWTQGRSFWKHAVLSGVLAGLMLATKETAAPILFLAIFSVLAARWIRRSPTATSKPASAPAFGPSPAGAGDTPAALLALAAAAGILLFTAFAVVLLVFTGFGRHPDQAFGLFYAIGPQLSRGTGSEHAYPAWTYLAWLCRPTGAGIPWSGWLLPVLAFAGLWAERRHPLGLALTLWALLLFLFFSALPYKTPWLMLAWLLPLSVLAGLGWSALWQTRRAWSLVVAATALVLLGRETWERCQVHAVDPENSLAYSPSSPDLARLEKDVDALAARQNGGRNEVVVQVIAQDYWPLPWTLRKYPRTGYWTEPPAHLAPGIVLSGPEFVGHLSGGSAKFEPYSIRPGVFVFLRKDPPAT